MKAILNYLDGKKTIFGLVLLQLSEVVEYPTWKMVLQITGWVLTGTGAGHKLLKK